jgi:hypothetical protein
MIEQFWCFTRKVLWFLVICYVVVYQSVQRPCCLILILILQNYTIKMLYILDIVFWSTFYFIQIWKQNCTQNFDFRYPKINGHNTFKYEFCTCTPKLSNQNSLEIWDSLLIGCFFEYECKNRTWKFYDQNRKAGTIEIVIQEFFHLHLFVWYMRKSFINSWHVYE